MRSGNNLRYLQSAKALLDAPLVKQGLFMLGTAASVALGVGLYNQIQEPIYRPLDYQITSQNLPTVIDTLEKANIQYKVNARDGMVLVPADSVQTARFRLASAGVARDDGFTFNYLNEQGTIGNSQFMENARYLRALESDLAKTLTGVDGVSSARVHIAIPQNNIFADENRQPTASIFITTVPGLLSDKEKVRAIVQIVASSVPSLDPKNVAITDQYGHYLTGTMDQNAIFNAEQLDYQNNLQNYYEKRITGMIIPIMGENKVSVRVNANLDFSNQEEATEQYDPKTVLRSEKSLNEQSGSGGAAGVPGALTNSPPQGGGSSVGTGGGGSQQRNESIKNYEASKTVSYKRSNYAKINSLSVAVVVDNEMTLDPNTNKMVPQPLSTDKINQITDLVKASIGFDEKRGDKVTVVNSGFTEIKPAEPVKATPLWNQPWFWDMVKKYVGTAVGFIILIMAYRRLSKFLRNDNEGGGGGPKGGGEGGFYITDEMQALKQEQINRLRELANREPNKVASVIKDWIGK